MSAPFVNVKWRTLSDLADWLEGTFRKECIRSGEDVVDAHRRAAEVNLAHRLAATIKGRQPEDIED